MKLSRTRNNMLILIVSLATLGIWTVSVLPQENEDYMKAYKLFWIPRLYPRDTIPGGAYENAFAQYEALRQMSGYQFPSGDWLPIGPKPLYAWGNVMSCRVNNIKYDPT